LTEKVERVKISEFRVERAPVQLKISGLGSCVALAYYDPGFKIGGLAHILLPGPTPGGEAGASQDAHKSKYADQAVPALMAAMEQAGCSPRNIVAKIAGGSNMFQGPPGAEQEFPVKAGIGDRNVEAVKKLLHLMDIHLDGEDVGGYTGRSILFELDTGRLIITNLRGHKVVL
jgi:chemotaxis protein CheD